ncbi:MAG: tyrosine-type recombinase/integrase [Polyangiaceae bacterium]
MSVRKRKWKDRATGMMNECWMVDVTVVHPDGRRERVRRVAPIQTKREAERYEREVRHELLDGPRVHDDDKADAPLFSSFSQRFMETYARNNNKRSEIESKEATLRLHLVPAFGRLTLDRVDAMRIEGYKARKLEEGLSAKTINNQLTVLRRLLSIAVEWGLLDFVPPIRWLKAARPEFDFLTFDEAERLIAAAEPEWRAIITVATRTGLRIGELLALRWRDVDLEAGRLVVRRSTSCGEVSTPKNGRTREVPLSDQARAALLEHRHERGELVFCDDDGAMLTRNSCRRPLHRACKRAGIRRIGWHKLRHTFASHLTMRGAPLKSVQELLGHGTIEMTMRYAHLSPDARRDAVKLLDEPAPSKSDDE